MEQNLELQQHVPSYLVHTTPQPMQLSEFMRFAKEVFSLNINDSQILNVLLEAYKEDREARRHEEERAQEVHKEQEFNAALAKAQASFKEIKKNGFNPHAKYKYALLDDVIQAVREGLTQNGLCFTFTTDIDKSAKTLSLTCWLRHTNGFYITETMPADFIQLKIGEDIHKMGATITYLKRYTLSALIGVAPDSDTDAVSQPPLPILQTLSKPKVLGAKATPEQIEALNTIIAEVGINVDAAKAFFHDKGIPLNCLEDCHQLHLDQFVASAADKAFKKKLYPSQQDAKQAYRHRLSYSINSGSQQ